MKHQAFFAFFVLILGFFAPARAESPAGPFSDVPAASPYALAAGYLQEKNILAGFSDGSFHPEKKVTRAQALAMIFKIAGIDTKGEALFSKQAGGGEPALHINFQGPLTVTVENPENGEKTVLEGVEGFRMQAESGTASFTALKKSQEKPFRDVSSRDWYYDIVGEAKRRGIAQGMKNGKFFRPKGPVNLAETLRMLFKAKNIDTNLSGGQLPAGISGNEWYAQDFAYAAHRTMLTQQEDGTVFPPHESLTRGQLAMILYRFLKTEGNSSFGYASWYADGLAKTKLTSGLEYKEKNLTAAHRTLPMGSLIKVTNVTNGKTVTVVVNDRGPFVTGRIIDLSKTAFSALESPTMGIMQVEIEPILEE